MRKIVAPAVKDCIVALTELSNARAAEIDGQDDVWPQEQTDLLRLWSEQLGVFASDRLSIEHRLHKNLAFRQAICQLILAMTSNVRSRMYDE